MTMTDFQCSQGHRYTEENTYMHKDGSRRCRTCNRERQAERRIVNQAEDMAAKRGTRPSPVSVTLRAVSADTEAWREYALCGEADPEAFFPTKGGSTAAAKRICGQCEVRKQCLEYALANDERDGIWGGLSEQERKALRRQSA